MRISIATDFNDIFATLSMSRMNAMSKFCKTTTSKIYYNLNPDCGLTSNPISTTISVDMITFPTSPVEWKTLSPDI